MLLKHFYLEWELSSFLLSKGDESTYSHSIVRSLLQMSTQAFIPFNVR